MSDAVAIQLIVSFTTLAGLIATAILQRKTNNSVKRVETAVNGHNTEQIKLIDELRREVEQLKLGRRATDIVAAREESGET